jgi:hypothetical protein
MAVSLSALLTPLTLLPETLLFLSFWYSILLEFEYTPAPNEVGRIR